MPAVGRSDVTVIGAGVIGVATACELARRGASVTLLERGPAPAAGCSAGNAGVVGVTHVVPLSGPASLREGLRSMTRRNAPLGIDARPAALPWLARFVRASSPGHFRAGTRVLAELALESAAMHRELAERLPTGLSQNGMMSVFERAASFEAARAHAAPGDVVLDGAQAHAACPQLATAPAGGILSPADAHCDPERLVDVLAAEAAELGVKLRTGVEVLGFRSDGRSARALRTTAGELPVGEVVLAAGAWSPELARALPIAVPILGGKGYHIDYEQAWDAARGPVYFPEHRVVATPLGERLRVSGMLQLTGTDLRVDQARVDAIVGHARRLLPGLGAARVQRVWRGLRPCTPDGLPMIGRTPGIENVTFATGHGMWGLQLAPITAQLVGEIVAGEPDSARLHPLRPERFTVRRARRASGVR